MSNAAQPLPMLCFLHRCFPVDGALHVHCFLLRPLPLPAARLFTESCGWQLRRWIVLFGTYATVDLGLALISWTLVSTAARDRLRVSLQGLVENRVCPSLTHVIFLPATQPTMQTAQKSWITVVIRWLRFVNNFGGFVWSVLAVFSRPAVLA